MLSQTADFYADPQVYEVLHAPGTEAEVDALVRIARRRLPPGPLRWLEPACGTARCLRELARRGHRGIGFDISPDMVRFASARARDQALGRAVQLFQADMGSFHQGRRIPRCDAAFNLINTIRHLPSDAQFTRHLNGVAGVLAPRGFYVIGLSLSAYGMEEETEDVWTGAPGPMKVTQVVQYLPPRGRTQRARSEHVFSHLTVLHDGAERHIDSRYTLRAYDLAQWTRLVNRSGWSIVESCDHDGNVVTAVEPGYFLFVIEPANG